MEIKGIIFDLDGVLTDTARFHFLAWKKLADEHGFSFTEKDNERLKGVDRMTSLHILLEINGAQNAFTEEEKQRMAAKKNGFYTELISSMTPNDVLPGILPFLEELREAGIKTAVASASKNASFVLSRIGLTPFFDYVANAAQITHQKPHPEIFSVCARELGLAPSACLGVEDAQAGIHAIRDAGMPSVGIRVDVTDLEPDLPLFSTSELTLARLRAAFCQD